MAIHQVRAGSVVGLTAALMMFAVACASDETDLGQPVMLRGEAHAAEGAISIETADWTYAVPLDGVSWVAEDDVWHDSGRPDCLQPSDQVTTVTFAAVEVTVEGTTWRPVIWVHCRV